MICSGVCRRRFIAVLSSFPTSWGSDSHNWWISSRGPGQQFREPGGLAPVRDGDDG
jgi:hypothetical protein